MPQAPRRLRIAVLDDYLGLALRLADWSAVQRRADVVVFNHHLDEADAARELQEFDAVCLMRERMAFPGRLIERLPRLAFIGITGPQHRTLDETAARNRGIVISSALGGEEGRSATPELTWGLILSLARSIPLEVQSMKEGGWQSMCGNVLRGKTLGLLGLGRIGRQMVPVAHAFGMNVLAWSPRLTVEAAAAAGATYTSKPEVFARSDFVSLHLVLSERSHCIVGAGEIALMKPSAYLVNTARAGLVDQDALFDALKQRRIAGAALDVHEEEPLPAANRFRPLPNALLTPHLGYAVEEVMGAFYRGTVENLLMFLDGAPRVAGGA